MKRVTAILAKSPEAGRVKTRLIAEGVSSEWASGLASAFLVDTATVLYQAVLTSRMNAEPIFCVDGDESLLTDFVATLPRLTQRGNSLGERIVYLCDEKFAKGAEALVIVGSDCPHLPVAFVQEAFGRLAAGTDAVFGPAEDGGYYLVGLRRPLPILFENIPWSTADVLSTTLNVAAQNGIQTSLLPSLYDIDTLADVDRLTRDLKRGVASAPATAAFLAANLPAIRKHVEEK